ncbi:hypothetical protein HYPSUDRAFT_203044 [Hypholoma sublateritium FD-334 SS-4]|uniref:Uncharacterized protein n=1 Tax=Hypholoma sublateritium (strain FD-334 SS-4) TaxID=945553 RepID=A0A0D2NR90_HYPSF|nr:hypothetical protein HYPSUDRAFT_203044 [Hypholoma sublateritium FD-334 SS-4]
MYLAAFLQSSSASSQRLAFVRAQLHLAVLPTTVVRCSNTRASPSPAVTASRLLHLPLPRRRAVHTLRRRAQANILSDTPIFHLPSAPPPHANTPSPIDRVVALVHGSLPAVFVLQRPGRAPRARPGRDVRAPGFVEVKNTVIQRGAPPPISRPTAHALLS